jgi:hypothetical protein
MPVCGEIWRETDHKMRLILACWAVFVIRFTFWKMERQHEETQGAVFVGGLLVLPSSSIAGTFGSPPAKEDYTLNPAAQAPEFELKDDLYIMSADLDKALRDGRRLVLLDTRVMALWQMANIERTASQIQRCCGKAYRAGYRWAIRCLGERLWRLRSRTCSCQMNRQITDGNTDLR